MNKLNLSVGICDDDIEEQLALKKMLEQYMFAQDMDIPCRTFSSGFDLLNDYNKPGDFHVLFLDVEMPDMNGLDLAKKIKTCIEQNVYIIFVSNYPQYMQDSFRVHPFYYLVKPISYETICYTMNDILSSIHSQQKLYTLVQYADGSEHTININDIYQISVYDSRKQLLCFCFSNFELVCKGTISYWKNLLHNHNFTFARRNCLINLAHIHYFQSHHIILENGTAVTLGRQYEAHIRNLYKNNILELKNI